ncbi:MAG: metallophosphoesterase [Anaerolineales bacterium]
MIKIALLADIHANFPALLSVSEELKRWNPDSVFVLGDAINRGPRPKACLQYLLQKRQEENWQMILGNHEAYVLQFEEEGIPRSGPRFDILQFVYWTYQKLSREELQAIKNFPRHIDEKLPTGQHLRAVHASMAGLRAGIYPHTPPEKLRDMIQPAPDILCVGHTHKPLIRTLDETKIVNAGSVGLPFDGNTRPSYAQIRATPKGVEIAVRRFDYDRDRAIQDFYETNFMEEGGPMVKIILQELLSAKPLINRWHREYEQKVLSGQCTLAESVEAFLQTVQSQPDLLDS